MKHIRNKIVSYSVILKGYDIEGEEYIIPVPEFAYTDIDQAIYEWEQIMKDTTDDIVEETE
jgi:hypothetical protein